LPITAASSGEWVLSLLTKELSEELATFLRSEPRDDLRPMVVPRVNQDLIYGAVGTGLWVIGGIINSRNPCHDNGPGAHDARLEGDKETRAFQAPRPVVSGGLSDGDHLRMSGGILEELPLVMSLGNHASRGHVHHYRPDRHLVSLQSLPRLLERQENVLLRPDLLQKRDWILLQMLPRVFFSSFL